MPTYTYSGTSTTHDVSNTNYLYAELVGAPGEDGWDNRDGQVYGVGGDGGYAAAVLDVSQFNTIEIWVGGGDGETWGRSNGGDGAGVDDTGGNGGGSTELVAGDGTFLMAADAGGGGNGQERNPLDSAWMEPGGGGGARGGAGGQGYDNNDPNGTRSGEDAQGTGFGGDGGGNSYASDGEDGGAEINSTYVYKGDTTSTGGGNTSGNGEIVLINRSDDVPQNVGAKPLGPSTNEITWDSVGSAVEYTVYWSTSSGSDFEDYNEAGTTSETSFEHTGLTEGSTYYYRVTSTDADGNESFLSSEDSATPESEPDPPSVNLTETIGTEITLDWDSTELTDEYRVYRSTSSGTTVSDYTHVATTSTIGYTDSSLVNGREYFYRVTAYNADYDAESDPSNEVNTTTNLPAPTVSSDASVLREITLDWTKEDNNPDGEWEIDKNGGLYADGLALSKRSNTDDGLLDGVEHTYVVRRVTPDATAETTVSEITILPAVKNLTVESIDGRYVTLSWVDPSNNASGYRLLLSEDDNGSYEQDGSDIDPVSEGETVTHETTELLDGQLYGATVETFTADTSIREDQ